MLSGAGLNRDRWAAFSREMPARYFARFDDAKAWVEANWPRAIAVEIEDLTTGERHERRALAWRQTRDEEGKPIPAPAEEAAPEPWWQK